MVTFNGSCWTVAKALIEETKAHILFIQEVRLDREQCLEAKDALKKKGWVAFFSGRMVSSSGWKASSSCVPMLAYLRWEWSAVTACNHCRAN